MLVKRAEEFAKLVHRNQCYGELPYYVHLKEVYLTLLDFGVTNEKILAASWLHDSMEDTSTTYETLLIQFGKEVADLVLAVTNEKGVNRKEILEKTAPKIKNNEAALVIKLADRIVNTEFSIDNNSKLYKMYEKEFPRFRTLLSREEEKNEIIVAMWKHLANLYNPLDEEVGRYMYELITEKWWDEEKDKCLTDSYSLLALLITPIFTLNEEEYNKVEEFLKSSAKGTKFKITIEEIDSTDDLEEREARYYDDCYPIVEERMYDQ